MRLLYTIRQLVDRLRSSPLAELGRGARFLRFQISLWRFCSRRLSQHNAMAMSSALSFRTILALVPTLVLALLIAKSLGVFADSKAQLRDLLARAGFSSIALSSASAPATGPTPAVPEEPADSVTAQIMTLIESVEQKLTLGRIGPIGVLLLIWTSVTLLSTIESSLNRIFEAPAGRSLAKQVPLYWSVITLMPIAYAAVVYMADRATIALATVPVLGRLVGVLGWIGRFAVAVLVLASVYRLMPNAPVRWRWAVGGSAVAVPLWMLAEYGLAFYVQQCVGSGNLYGTLGLLPLALFWLNTCWLIFLFGAQIAYTGANLSQMEAAELAERLAAGPRDLLAVGLAVARAYAAGQGPATLEGLARDTGLPAPLARHVLDRLAGAGLVTPVAQEAAAAYVLTRPPEQVPVLQVLDLLPSSPTPSRTSVMDPGLERLIDSTLAHAQTVLREYTLADVLRGRPASGDRPV